MTRTSISVVLAFIAGLAYCCYRHDCRLRRTRSRAAPEHIQTWEEEGGGVPLSENKTAAQVDPQSTSTPKQPLEILPDVEPPVPPGQP